MQLLKCTSDGNPKSLAIAEKAFDLVIQQKQGGLTALFQQLSEFKNTQNFDPHLVASDRVYVLIGIGGSSLGVRVLSEIFGIKNFFFLDNVDAFEFEEFLKDKERLKKCVWIFTSKSGRTVETLATLEYLNEVLNKEGIQLSKNSMVITENKPSDLFQWAVDNYVPIYEIPLTVGGRFSVLSSVGLVPALLMGLDLTAFEAGAAKALQDRQIITQLAAQYLESFERQEWLSILWCYSSRLKSFGMWWQQLWSESLAKSVSKTGGSAPRVSTPIPLVGATDQHSVLQQIMEGAKDKFVLFLRVKEAEQGKLTLSSPQFKETKELKARPIGHLLAAEAEAIQIALSEVKVHNATLMIEKFNEENVGRLFMMFQLLVMTMGEILNINTFDQPGVEHGKILAKKILNQQQPEGHL
jgi:glucose-6-phosphate isomerase